MTKRLLVAGVAVALALPLAAHHGWSNYHEDKPLTLDGVIKESTYENPHGTAKLEVEGKVWHVILAPVSRMERNGLTREMLKPGNKAKVLAYPHRSVEDEVRAEHITIDGKTVQLRR